MTEKEMAGLRELMAMILLRHTDDDAKAVAMMMIDIVFEVYENGKGGIVQ